MPVMAPASGTIEEFYVQSGDTVKAGQKLFRMKVGAVADKAAAPQASAPAPPPAAAAPVAAAPAAPQAAPPPPPPAARVTLHMYIHMTIRSRMV